MPNLNVFSEKFYLPNFSLTPTEPLPNGGATGIYRRKRPVQEINKGGINIYQVDILIRDEVIVERAESPLVSFGVSTQPLEPSFQDHNDFFSNFFYVYRSTVGAPFSDHISFPCPFFLDASEVLNILIRIQNPNPDTTAPVISPVFFHLSLFYKAETKAGQ